jgi:uncharacterized BrkB/YihY/UPF0761 family membrane protein
LPAALAVSRSRRCAASFRSPRLRGFSEKAAKHGFAFYLTHVPTYEIVYGALAALPVFLVCIYVCWLIVLSGAAITATLTLPHESLHHDVEPARTRTSVRG